LENELLAIQVFKEKAEALQKLGYTEEEIRRILLPTAKSSESCCHRSRPRLNSLMRKSKRPMLKQKNEIYAESGRSHTHPHQV
jgi:hypothetical protein